MKFRRAGQTIDPGGTAVEEPAKLPLLPLVVVFAIGAGTIAYFALRTGPKSQVGAIERAVPEKSLGTGAVATTTVAPAPDPVQAAQPAGPSPDALAADLDRSLKRQRLWSTVTVVGQRVDVRSGSCGEPAMATALDATARAFKAAGLTKLRCLEQSGRVVIDRDL